ncbi:MAG: hypothetical protein ACOCV7_05040 [Desulfonatronovibrionaceae bacterium]
MDQITLLVYMLILLLVVIGNSLIYKRLRQWRFCRLKTLDAELKEMEDSYASLTHEINEARSIENRLKAELVELKKTSARQDEQDKTRDKPKTGKSAPRTPVDILKQKGLVDDEQIEKARHYLERSDNPGLKMEDALALLGHITSDQLKSAQNEAGKKP